MYEAEVLELRGVVKRYGAATAVDGLDLELRRAEVLALLGPNGAGKTTTVEMCEGFLVPDDGVVRVLGMDPAEQADEIRGRIGVMLQGGGAYPGIRVGEMLRLAASYSSDPLDPRWLLDTVGLTGHESTAYRRLSGGEQQRLSLAMALVGRPELVFLDEPTAGLDAQSRLLVWDLVSALRRDGVAVVLTTHLMDEAEALADRVVIMDHGTVVARGTTAELTTGQEPTLSLSTDRDLDVAATQAWLDRHGQSTTVRRQRPRQYCVDGAVTPEAVAAVTAAAADQGVLVSTMSVDHRSLEDVFHDITGREMRA